MTNSKGNGTVFKIPSSNCCCPGCGNYFSIGQHSPILRPLSDCYTLIGPCYVHGIMGGELYDHGDRYCEDAGGFARKCFFEVV
ncbi:hypothetical protein P154DRAFT_526024 [Amniculicola lignicola CBS 123094]|uniref:Uncharacterized protein n=1 Tax=Amniculicola lignicola CBS 123094 TaxID=1392246 RepID=A0A6A5W761_9PLEO|nr:hypothetical protein P154DRAFT_526024 [Amniculicola lignicola CBS 123094]